MGVRSGYTVFQTWALRGISQIWFQIHGFGHFVPNVMVQDGTNSRFCNAAMVPDFSA
jgi:hypothetical protein